MLTGRLSVLWTLSQALHMSWLSINGSEYVSESDEIDTVTACADCGLTVVVRLSRKPAARVQLFARRGRMFGPAAIKANFDPAIRPLCRRGRAPQFSSQLTVSGHIGNNSELRYYAAQLASGWFFGNDRRRCGSCSF